MPEKKGETYLEYKKRVIDKKSASFCAAKWFNSTIWLGSGMTTSCHHPPAHSINLKELADNPSAIHNTTHKKQMRKMMLEGTRPPECEYCWKIEDIKRDNISDRVFKTVIYEDKDIEEITEWDTNVDLKTLEIAFDSNCNFACSYCNPSFSTKWAQDINQNGNYKNLKSDGAKAFMHNGAWARKHKNEENPYIEAFWNWWPKLSQSFDELRVTGGEPLMSAETWKLIDFFIKEESNIRLSINSNLGAKADLVDRLIDSSNKIKNFSVYTSCEAVGSQAEYIRDGLKYDYWKSNVEKLLDKGGLSNGLHIMMTINSLCLFNITELFDQILDWKKQYGGDQVYWSVNLLRFPSFMSALALPDHIKNIYRELIKVWL
ncbi:MAG: twitch domain-containing radical SAM protein, partial [Bdellovibrionales bacterium]|nr:twitch domain-containing radical SAM protein [Bdellovibrionales bacterium]